MFVIVIKYFGRSNEKICAPHERQNADEPNETQSKAIISPFVYVFVSFFGCVRERKQNKYKHKANLFY